MKVKWKLYVAFAAMFVMFCMSSMAVFAEDTITVGVTGTYGQTEARSMLQMINDFRTGSEAWYWNADNTTKTVYSSANGNALSPLAYDYELEQAAMLRAMEIAVSYSHTRPSGGKAWTLFSWSATGENIAAGYRTAEAVFEGWQETNDDYSGQGHRRNMLSPKVTAVGIGHVYYNGYHYWVQLFRAPVGNTAATAPNDSETTVAVEILPSAITSSSVSSDVTSLTVPYGGTAELPKAVYKIGTADTWPLKEGPVQASYTWAADSSGCISIASGKISGNKAGTASITTTIQGKTLTIPVTVTPLSVSSASISLSTASYTYDGTAKEPSVSSVTLGGKVLTANADYTVSWSNNINAGTATVTVTGKGNYTGTASKTFQIAKADLSTYSVSDVAAQTYGGSALTPEITVSKGTARLTKGTDYTVSYTNNQNAGTATIKVTGSGNYTGTLTGTFTIAAADLGKGSISSIANQTYTGKALTPSVTVKYASAALKNGTDYSVSYTSNTKVGTATVTVKGIGNYTGTLTGTFTIAAADLSKGSISSIANQTWTGKALTPSVTVKYGSADLKNGTDYSVSYTSNTKVGTAKVTVKGTGNYKGTLTKTFKIVEPVTPAKGKSVKDKASGATYKITKAGTSKTATVEYTKYTGSKTTVTVPDTIVINNVTCKVTSIAASAFKNNKKIKTVTIGKNVTSIGKNAFYGCTKLQKVTVGSRVTSIGNSAFYGCTKLSTLTIGSKVSSIGAKAFAKCTALKKVTIPASVTSIGSQAFYGCKNLKTVTIKTTKLTAKKVGSKAFTGTHSKAAFKVPASKVSAYKKLLKSKGIGTKATVTK